MYWVCDIDVVFVAKAVSGVIVVAVKQFASVWFASRLLLGVLPPTVELKFLKKLTLDLYIKIDPSHDNNLSIYWWELVQLWS